MLCLLMLSYAKYSRSHRALSRSDAKSDHQMTHRRRCSLPRPLVELGRGRGAADGRRLLSHVRDLIHLRRIIIRNGCSDAPGHCHSVASRPRAAVPFMSWRGVPPTDVDDKPAPTHPPATVVTSISGKGAVPENDFVRFRASATSPSRAMAVS